MNMSKEIKEKINSLFADNDEVRNKLLALDADTIRKIGSASQLGINPSDIIAAYEDNNSGAMEELYNRAKKILELQELYKELCLEYYHHSKHDGEER